METHANRTVGSRIGAILATVGLGWLWSLTYLFVIKIFGLASANPEGTLVTLSGMPTGFVASLSVTAFLTACLLAPLVEEALCRAMVCSRIDPGPNGTIPMKDWWLIIGVCGILFGWAHAIFSYQAVALQGVLGVLWARLWLRNGPSHFWSFLSVVVAHGLHNYSVLAAISLFMS